MLEIYKIPVATPYPIGPVNCYLIKSRPYTLLDPGPATIAAKNSLEAGLKALGVELNDIGRVVLTHSHLDHSGLAQWISEISGAPIYMHSLELRKLSFDFDFYMERFAFFQEAGLPSAVLYEILGDFDPVDKPKPFNANVFLLNGGESLTFTGGVLEVKHLPGHSDGHIGLYDEKERRLLAGDVILKEVTPNPNMEPNPSICGKRLPALEQYFESLRQLDKLCPKVILPGHGENIDDSQEVISFAREHHQVRLQKVYDTLKNNCMSIYQLMRLFYPKISGFEIYLGISELYAHVDYLVSEGKLVKQDNGAFSLFQALI